MKPLEGKVALVTGASRSLGLHIAGELIARGARVVITGRDPATLAAAAERLGPAALALEMDVRSPHSVRAVFERAHSHMGRLDILVNNAAMGCLHRIEAATDAELQDEIDTNLMGVLYCIRAAVPLMRVAGGGDIVSVSSESVLMPFPMLTSYAASKAAVECLSTGLRDELREDNIRVSILRSGNIAESGFGGNWLELARSEAFSIWKKSGHLAMVGAGADPQVIASALADMVVLPRNAGIELLTVRGR